MSLNVRKPEIQNPLKLLKEQIALFAIFVSAWE